MLYHAEEKFKERKNIATGSIRISAADTNITHFLMRYVKKFHELYPNVTITFKDSTTSETIALIKSNKADIGLVNLPVYDDDIICTGQTGIVEDIFVANRKFENLFDKVIDLKDISNYPILMLEQSTTTSKEINTFLETMSVNIVPEFTVGSVELLIEMAKEGFGIACVPRRYVREQLEKKELFELNVVPALPLRATGVVVSKDVNSQSFALREFIRILDDDQYDCDPKARVKYNPKEEEKEN